MQDLTPFPGQKGTAVGSPSARRDHPEHGINRLSYAYQDRPGGIAEALGLAERFADVDRLRPRA